MTSTLGRQILAAQKAKVEAVPFGEFTVFVHTLTTREISAFHSSIQQAKKDLDLKDKETVPEERVTELLAAHSIRDAEGARLFSDEQAGEMWGFAGLAFQPVLTAVLRLNGVTKAEADAEKKLPPLSSDSGCGSPT